MNAPRSRRRVATALAAALLAGAGAAWFTGTGDSSAPVTSAETLDGSGRAPSTSPTTSATTRGAHIPLVPQRTATGPTVGLPAPTRLEIPSADIRMPVRPVALDARGDMELPASPTVAGWYRFGPAPGSPAGAAVIAAHLDAPGQGIGPFVGLQDLEPGDEVVVRSGPQTRRYSVTSVRSVGKARLDLGALFSRSGAPRLHLVTCGGEFDQRTRAYAQNVVVVAVPVS